MTTRIGSAGVPGSGDRPLRAVPGELWSFWTDGRPVERWCYRIGVLLVVVGLAHLGVLAATGWSWQGPVSWRKPTTFGLSFGLTLLTITWVASFLALGPRARRLWLGLFAAACVLEVGLITLQAWRGVPSHFNLETTFDAIIARTLAVGGGVLIVIIATLTVVAFRGNPAVSPSMRLAVRVGFLALLFALAVGAVMIAEGMVSVFAGRQQEAYAVAGSLKPAHAVTMHGILVLPALAWLLSLTGWDESRRLRLVWIAVAGYALLAGVVVAVSFAGIAPARAPVVAGAFAVLGTAVLFGAGVVALAELLRPTASA
jgi:hypothetical protein